MSARDDKNQKERKRYRSRSPERPIDRRGDRGRSRSNERGSKRGDRHRSRSNDRGNEKKSDKQEKKSSRRSRSRSKSRDRGDRGSNKSHSERDKDREKDREKDRDKDREKDRNRDKDRDSNHSSSSHAERDSKDSKKSTTGGGGGSGSGSVGASKAKALVPSAPKTEAELEKDREAQKDEEQAVLDDEMRKRRERVKAWQDEKTKRIADANPSSSSGSATADSSSKSESKERDNGGGGYNGGNSTGDSGAWNLEDDDDDDKEDQTGDTDDVEMILPSPSNADSDAGISLHQQDPNGVAVFDHMTHVRPRKMSIGSSPRNSAVKLDIKFDATPSSVTGFGVGVGNAGNAVGKNMSTGVSALPAALSSSSASVHSSALSASKAPPSLGSSLGPTGGSSVGSGVGSGGGSVGAGVPDFDPLDDFMSSLYGEGGVEEQRSLPTDSAQQRQEVERIRASALSSSSRSVGLSRGMGVGGGGDSVDVGEDNPQETESVSGSVTDDDFDEYTLKGGDKVNPFGSNFITLDQIMGSKSPLRTGGPGGSGGVGGIVSSSSSRLGYSSKIDYSNSGWESDSAPPSPMHGQYDEGSRRDVTRDGETEEEREDREDMERKEFIDAIRAARAAEEVVRERAQQKEEAAEKSKEQLGRVFAGEGDVMDERDVEEKKKSALEILEESKKGKELKPVDHKTIEYIPFRKNLYIVPRALSRLTEDDLNEKREDLQIKVRGKGCPAPVDTWGQCGLSERVLGVIEKLGLEAPFAIQKQAIPAIMCGRDLIGVAKTGSGKTLAFLLPMFRHIMDQPPLRDQEGPIGLIMAPARELAFQIFNEAKKFSKSLGIRVACVYGGAGVADQIADLKRGAEIVVCTPGRMIDILCMQAGKLVNLRRVTMVVLDEADRCFDMGFAPQIEMVLQNIRPDRQTVLFSATFPKQIEKLAKTVLRLPLEVVVGERSSVNKDITQVVEVHEDADKFMRLLQLLGVWYEKGSVLVFVDTQEKCDQLFHDLLKSGYPCLSLHGGKDQLDRDHTLHEFKKGIKTVMVATSVAGRGLDVPDIVVVVNYNCPNHIEDYVHRVGRTGRAGRKGTAYTFISPSEEQYSPLMIKALEKAGQTPAPELQEIVAAFKEKVSRGEARYSSSGFEGKGFTFDASELSETQKNNSLQRRAYDVEQGIEEKDEDEEEGEEGGGEKDKDKALTPAVAVETPLDRARAIATSLCLFKGLPIPIPVPLPVPTASLSLDGTVDSRAAMARAKLIASQLASGGKFGESAGEAKEPAAHYSEELEINDYPPQARRKVTHKNALDDVSEQTGVAITSRGSFVPAGKKLEVGERRLYLLLEGSTDLQVRQAKLEILRLLDEETMRLGASGNTSFGRYAVL